MEITYKIKGLDDALKAIEAAFPKDPKMARKILNQSMSGAAKKNIIPAAKQMALIGDGSGALSEAIAPRAVSARRAYSEGVAASIHITPVRSNRSAMLRYINFYYTAKGRVAPAKMVTSGIRHGHLIEFGTSKQSARPFLWPAAQSGRAAYAQAFADSVGKKIAAAVRRKAKQ